MGKIRNIQDWVLAHLDVVAVMVLTSVVYLNISDILIKHHGLPGINKTLVPPLLLLVVIIQIRNRSLFPGLLLMIACALGYYSFHAGTLLYADNQEYARKGISILLKNIIIAVIISGLILRPYTLRIATWSLLVSAAFVSVLSIIAYFSGDINVEFGGLHRWNVHYDRFGRILTARVAGQIGDPNFFAQVLLMILPLGLMFAFNRSSTVQRIAAAVLSFIIVFGVICTLSRGAWLIMIVMMMAFLACVYWSYGQSRFYLKAGMLFASVLLVFSSYFLPAQIKNRFTGIWESAEQAFTHGELTDGAISGRIDEMVGAIHAFIEHPLIGIGNNNFTKSYQDYSRRKGLTARGRDRSAHSLYLQLLAEGGAIGFLLFIGLVYAALRSAIYVSRKYTALGLQDDVYYIRGFIFGYIAYLGAAMFLHESYPRFFWLFTGILIGTLNLTARYSDQKITSLYTIISRKKLQSILASNR